VAGRLDSSEVNVLASLRETLVWICLTGARGIFNADTVYLPLSPASSLYCCVEAIGS
jgi:hypothetical protein